MNFLDKKYYAVYNYNYIFINRLMKGGRSVWVHPLPISIPFARFNQLAGSAAETTCAADTQVTSEVQTVITRGHTRAHQSVVIESEGEAALYTGDLATLAVHFERLAWVTAYDVEPLETIATKRRWLAASLRAAANARI